ncbi:hypothetical protein, partial [Serratia marcescens]|uniref:hypothetical protein n=1 Tax=Serratia marcescens TaxID=615 RepID=UPI0019531A92
RKAERERERRAHLLIGSLILENLDESRLLRQLVKRVLQQEGPNSDVAKLVAARRRAMRETQECGRAKSPHRKAADATTS